MRPVCGYSSSGDMTVFGVLFTFYLIERSKQPELFDSSQATLNK